MSDLYVYLMRSRNKDNKNIEGFKERAKTILEYIQNEDRVIKEFKDFAAKGLPGEQTRLYRSVNSRNEEKIREEMIIRMLRDKPSMTKLNRTLASVAQQVDNRDESKWLFDFDSKNISDLDHFVIDMVKCYGDFNSYNVTQTPNGYAIVVEHGFDTRELLSKWKNVDITLKKDELLFIDIIKS